VFLLFISLLASSIQPLALWLSAIQVWSIFFAALKWESDQWLAKGGKYRGCRLLCQFCIIIIPGVIGSLLVFVASTFLQCTQTFVSTVAFCAPGLLFIQLAQAGARGKRRGFSPGAAARPLDRTRVMRNVARGEVARGSVMSMKKLRTPEQDSICSQGRGL